MKFPKLVEAKSTGTHHTEEDARELDNIVAGLPKDSAYKLKKKALVGAPEIDPNERAEVSVISTQDVDSQADIVIQDGLDFSLFDKGRVVLYQHDHERPVGKCVWYKNLGGKTVAKTEYPRRQDGYEGEWLSDKIWALTTAGIMPGKSVTILPVLLEEPTPEQRQKGAEIVWQKCMVLEYSVCAIPANSDCLVQAIEKGFPLDLLNIRRTGQMVKKRTKRTEYIDRSPELYKAVAGLKLDPEAIAERVLVALKQRGKVVRE